MNNLKNPKECASIVRNQTFILENMLSEASCEDGNEPLSIYHNTFARFKICIINKDKKSAYSSVKVSEIPGIAAKSRFALNRELDIQFSPKKEVSKAYTVKITSGYLKGKTPAEVLIENPENLKHLKTQFDFLKANVKKYPKNREVMEAIKEACELLKSETLNKNAAEKSSGSMEIYNSGFRYNMRKKSSEGLCRIREMRIVWNFGEKYPVSIEIRNYDAPLQKKNDGTVNVLASERKNSITNIFNMTVSEWEHILYCIRMNMRLFEDSVGGKMIKMADTIEKNQSRQYQNAVQSNIKPYDIGPEYDMQ